MDPSNIIITLTIAQYYRVLRTHLVEVEGGWLEPNDGDIVLVVPEEVSEETEKDGPHFLVHQLLGASLLEGLQAGGGGSREHVVSTVDLHSYNENSQWTKINEINT